MPVTLKVCSRRCGQCLFSSKKIVSDARKKDILKTLKSKDTHFICHKSPDGIEHVCHGSYKLMPQMVRIAGRMGLIEFVNPEPESKP
jgi:hypothetical protein